jgi:hypothetical protein
MFNSNQMQKARESYLRYSELDPQNPVPHFAVGNVDLAIVAQGNGDLSTEDKSRMIEEGVQMYVVSFVARILAGYLAGVIAGRVA